MKCSWCHAEVADPQAVFCSRCGRALVSEEAAVTERLEEREALPASSQAATLDPQDAPTDETPQISAETAEERDATQNSAAPAEPPQPPGERSQAAATAADMFGAVRRALRSGRWPEATSAAAIGFLAVLGVGALFVAVLKLFDPTLGVGRSPLWVLTRVVIAGLASLGIPVEQAGLGGSILPMGALALIAWALVWAARTVVVRSRVSTAGERALEGLKMAPPFAVMCCAAALAFRVRSGLDFGADPGMALLFGGGWAALFGAVGGLLAGGSLGGGVRWLRSEPGARTIFEEGWAAALTMLVTATVMALAAALILLIIELTTGTDVPMTAGDAVAIVFLLLVFAPNIALGTAAFSLGAPIRFMAETFGAGFRADYSLLGWNGIGPEWYVYFALSIPLVACLFGGFAARRRAHDPARAFEVIGIAAGVFAVVFSLLVYVSTLSLDRGFLGRGTLLVLAPDATAVFFLALLWAGGLGALGWKIAGHPTAPSQPTEPARGSEIPGR